MGGSLRQTARVRFDVTPEPIADADEAIHAGVADAAPAPLLAAVAHLTGDLSLLRDELRPDLSRALEPDAGYSADQLALARRLAAEALIRHRDSGREPAAGLRPGELRRLVEFVAGGAVDPAALPLYETELALDGADGRAPDFALQELRPGRRVVVGIVGAGMSGIIAAHRLRQAGVEVVIFEKNDEVGGTWLENSYPGCRVDIQNHFYSYACAQTPDWPQFHSPQPVLLDYLRDCVEHFGLRDKIRFRTEVEEARWVEGDECWSVTTRNAEGAVEVIRVDALVCATGQLNRPSFPDIPGLSDFAGPSFHSARWDKGVDLKAKRVAVIGTGASAVQFIPRVAEAAESVTVFQRTPPWLLPVPIYQKDVPDSLRWLLRHVPQFANWDRLWIFARTEEGLLPLAVVDPEWEGGGASVSPSNDMLRQMLTLYYEAVFPDPSLRAKVLPDYPPIAKRVVLDDGTFPAALQRPNVTLETTPIERVEAAGVRTVDGALHEADVLLYGTGFQASRFLTPMRIRGRNGCDLHERWGGDARAYLGITVPGFPNLFMLYGPNTNIVINGSITFFSECQAEFIAQSIGMLARHDARSMECIPDVHDAYNVEIDEGNRQRAWGASKVHSWYKNEFGRVAQNWPFDLVRYWRQTRRPDPSDYRLR